MWSIILLILFMFILSAIASVLTTIAFLNLRIVTLEDRNHWVNNLIFFKQEDKTSLKDITTITEIVFRVDSNTVTKISFNTPRKYFTPEKSNELIHDIKTVVNFSPETKAQLIRGLSVNHDTLKQTTHNEYIDKSKDIKGIYEEDIRKIESSALAAA